MKDKPSFIELAEAKLSSRIKEDLEFLEDYHIKISNLLLKKLKKI